MAGDEAVAEVGLEDTPTYSVAFTAFAFILVSLIVERAIHRLKKYLKRKHQKPLRKVLDKMTDELMLLGFISLLLTVLQQPLIKICVTPNFSKHLLPCSRKDYEEMEAGAPKEAPAESHVSNAGRRLLQLYFNLEDFNFGPTLGPKVHVGPQRRLLAEDSGTAHCAAKGKVQFVTLEVLHQLHLFIFVLAVTHVSYCVLTVLLGFLRLHNWSKWEQETKIAGYDGTQDLEKKYCDRLRCERPHLVGLDKNTHAFVDRRANHKVYDYRITLWIVCFFQQFFVSVRREDYLTFRIGFLKKHHLSNSFNFRDYVIRSMEVDFKSVIGINWWLWLVVVLFLLLNVHDFYTYFWAAFIPAILILIIGTKQQHIISTLALQAKKHAADVLAAEHGDPKAIIECKKTIDISEAVSPSDQLFWFDNPRILLRLIHFVIFQNSFEIAVFFWLVTAFGWSSCILGNHKLLIVRLIVGIASQLLASYTTLPIYALVTQMGSHMKTTVFTKEVYDGLQGWKAKAARNRQKRSSTHGGSSSDDSSVTMQSDSSTNSTPSGTPRPKAPLSALPLERMQSTIPEVPPIDHQLSRRCQMLFGKQNGMDIVKAAQINPTE